MPNCRVTKFGAFFAVMIDDAILGSVAIVTTATSIRTEQQTIRVHLPVLPVLYPQKQLLLEYGSRQQ